MRKLKSDIPDYNDLPIWKVPFKLLGRVIMGLLFLILAVILPIGIFYFWDTIVGQQSYDLFGTQTSTFVIAVLALAIFVPIGIYGLIFTAKMIINDFKKKEYRLPAHTKLVSLLVIIFILFSVLFYTPGWYFYFGIKPKWGPYIAFPEENSMQISWDTPQKTTTRVIYGADPNNLDQEVFGGEFFWESGESTNHHSVIINDLEPNQKYYYKIPGFDASTYYFTTAPDVDSGADVCFTILGDTQGNLNVQKANIGQMVDSIGIDNLNYTIIVGDTVNDDDDIGEWDMLLNKDSYGRISPYVPWHATSGNHECGTERDYTSYPPRQNFKRTFQKGFLETRTKQSGAFDVGYYYSFNYSNVHMVFLDNFVYSYGNMSETQLQWLEEDLARNQDNWKFLCFHLSMYSSSDHGSYPELAADLEPIMDKYDVEAIFYGHDHIFEYYDVNASQSDHTLAFMCAGGGGSLKQVTNPSKMGDRVWPNTEEYINDWGNNFLEISKWTQDDRFESQYGWQWQVYAERTHHYMKVKVDGNEATFSAYRTFDNSLIKAVTYTKS